MLHTTYFTLRQFNSRKSRVAQKVFVLYSTVPRKDKHILQVWSMGQLGLSMGQLGLSMDLLGLSMGQLGLSMVKLEFSIGQ